MGKGSVCACLQELTVIVKDLYKDAKVSRRMKAVEVRDACCCCARWDAACSCYRRIV